MGVGWLGVVRAGESGFENEKPENDIWVLQIAY